MASLEHTLILGFQLVTGLPLHLVTEHLVAGCAESSALGTLDTEATHLLVCEVAGMGQSTDSFPAVPDPFLHLTPECPLDPYARLNPVLLRSLLLFVASEEIQHSIEMHASDFMPPLS